MNIRVSQKKITPGVGGDSRMPCEQPMPSSEAAQFWAALAVILGAAVGAVILVDSASAILHPAAIVPAAQTAALEPPLHVYVEGVDP